MTVRGLTEKQLQGIMNKLPLRSGYINTVTQNGLTHRLTLSLSEYKGKSGRKYQRLGFMRRLDGERIRIGSVCWHGHRDFMQAVFAVNSDAIIITTFIRYDGLDDFNDKFEDTYYKDVGSMMEPAYYGDLCLCE